MGIYLKFVQLDGQTLRSCPADTIILKNLTVNQRHNFVISINTGNGNSNSSSYSWFIGKPYLPVMYFLQSSSVFLMAPELKPCLYRFTTDTTPPTATISSKQSYTNAKEVEIVVAFSEPCKGKGGGFKCINSSNCDVRTPFTRFIRVTETYNS